MKNFFLKYLNKLILYYNDRIKLKLQPKSPSDLYLEQVSRECLEFFKEEFKGAFIFSDDRSIREFAISKAIENFKKEELFLEFGVFKGDSINLFAKNLSKINTKIYGFDSFKGLKNNWITEKFNPVGTFNLNSKIPKVSKNVQLINGWVEDTLEEFLDKNKNNINFAHMDLDTYESTSLVLKNIKKRLVSGSVVLFDEFYGFPNWEKYEYKAFIENFSKNEYKYIAFSNRQACIKIL
tara:strand:- start:151 stop:861 length:711 start_codon:yes stop_codon:yes gene_type:complete